MDKIIPIKLAPRHILELEQDEYEKRFQQLLEDGWQIPEWRRAGGDVECKVCGKVYYDHPNHDPILFLHVLCDGRLVKL